MSPERVPITSPSSGVNPIDVSTDSPPSIAHADAPLPRCSVMIRVVLARAAGELAIAIGDVPVRGAVKPVSADAMPTVQLIRDRVQVRDVGQAVMKRRVEDRHLRHAGPEYGARRGDAAQVVRVVQRRELDQLFQLAAHRVVDARRVREALAAVHHPMPDCFDLADAVDLDAGVRARQPGDHVLHRGGVVADRRASSWTTVRRRRAA